MKEHIEKLISLGWTKESATDFVRRIAESSFEGGAEAVDFDEEHGYSRNCTFDDWFDSEIK